MAASSCGASGITVGAISDQAGPLPFDTHTLNASATSPDDDPSLCPARFANAAYTYQWSVTAPGGARWLLNGSGNAKTTTGDPVTFAAGDNGTYTVAVSASASHEKGASTTSSTDISVSCSSPAPNVSAPVFDSPGAPSPGQQVKLGTSVSDLCMSASENQLSYTWQLTLQSGPGSAPMLSDPVFATPSFTIATAGQQLEAFVSVTDKWGRTGANSADLTTTS
jgi:hypothetical protein